MVAIREAQKMVKEFVTVRKWEDPPDKVFIHLVEEIGELAWILNHHRTEPPKEKLAHELGDIFYLTLKLGDIGKNLNIRIILYPKILNISKHNYI